PHLLSMHKPCRLPSPLFYASGEIVLVSVLPFRVHFPACSTKCLPVGPSLPSGPSAKGVPMLVLSRRINEKLLFPDIGTAVQVLSAKGNAVRLGIQAPPEVTVLREEVPHLRAEWAVAAQTTVPADAVDLRSLTRLVGNRLRVAGLGLDLLRGHLEAG